MNSQKSILLQGLEPRPDVPGIMIRLMSSIPVLLSSLLFGEFI